MSELIHVAAAALIDSQGRVLVAQRHAAAHQGGLWEFPGGKCESGETVQDALARELREELGVTPLQHRPLIRITHHYADRSVLLDVHRVTQWSGEVRGMEGQPIRWVNLHALNELAMPAADVPIIRALQLPETYLITPAAVPDLEAFCGYLQTALEGGIRLLQLRVFDLAAEQRAMLIERVGALCEDYAASCLLNGSREEVEASGLSGWHLNSRQLQALDARPANVTCLAASCHTPQDLLKAHQMGADFALLSPVLPTRSHPDAQPLGWATFKEWVDGASLPVYALGGMQPDSLDQAWQAGAQGIAGIRGLWPGEVT